MRRGFESSRGGPRASSSWKSVAAREPRERESSVVAVGVSTYHLAKPSDEDLPPRPVTSEDLDQIPCREDPVAEFCILRAGALRSAPVGQTIGIGALGALGVQSSTSHLGRRILFTRVWL